MSKLWPFANKHKALEAALKEEIKELHNKIDENDLDVELRDLESKSFSTADSSSSLSGTIGVVDEYYDHAMLQRLYSTETWFFIAVHTIAKTIASLPIKLQKRKKILQDVRQSDGTTDKVQKETWIDASAEPEYDILTCPNRLQSSVEFWMLIIIDLMATGDAFILVDKGEDEVLLNESPNTPEARLRSVINRRRKTRVRGLYRLSSGFVKPSISKQDHKVLAGYQINTEYGTFDFGLDEVVHIRLPNPNDPFYGLAPIIAVMKNLLLDKYSAEHMIRFYKQGARLGGVIKTDKKLTKDQLVRLERVFEANFTGKRNHHKTLILPEGMEYDTIEQNPGETSLIEFLKANKEPVLAAYNMPPIKVGLLDGATFANANIQDKTFYNDTIKPICRIIEECVNKHGAILPKMRELKFSFSFDEIEALKEDEVSKSTAAKGMLDAGMSINEVREKVWKLPPVEGGEMVPVIEKSKAPAPTLDLFGGKAAKTETTNTQNDTAALSDVVPTETTFEVRVSELVAQAIGQGIEPAVAVPKAIDQAIQEGFTPSSKTDDEKKSELKAPLFTKEFLLDYKNATTGDGIAHLIEEREVEVKAFFDRLEKYFIKKIKSKKSFCVDIVKADNGDEYEGGTFSEDDMTKFFQSELERLYEADQKAMRHGYKQSISNRPMTFPNEKALGILRTEGAKHIKSITDTTRNRINGILADSFDDQVSVGEIASRIRDVFPEIKASRAGLIAKQETLSAISLGQNLKAQEFRSSYPDEAKRMRKMWLSAGDDRVRDSHDDLNETSVGLDEEFKPGLKFPRDPNCSDLGEIIGCRCTTIEYLPEDQEEIESTVSNGSPLAEAVDEVE